MGLAVCPGKIFWFVVPSLVAFFSCFELYVWFIVPCLVFGSTCDTAWHEEDEPKQGKYNGIDHCQHLHFVILIIMTMTMRKLKGHVFSSSSLNWPLSLPAGRQLRSVISILLTYITQPANQPTTQPANLFDRRTTTIYAHWGRPGLKVMRQWEKLNPINLTNGFVFSRSTKHYWDFLS